MEKILASNPANGGANLIKARFLIKDGKNREAMNIITPLTTIIQNGLNHFIIPHSLN